MRDLKVAVPLTFALAMSIVGPNPAIAAARDPSELLKPGSLRSLVGSNETVIGDRAGAVRDQGVKRRMAQCWYGYWRRC